MLDAHLLVSIRPYTLFCNFTKQWLLKSNIIDVYEGVQSECIFQVQRLDEDYVGMWDDTKVTLKCNQIQAIPRRADAKSKDI